DPPPDPWLRAAADPDPSVRRRAADLAPNFAGRIPPPPAGAADSRRTPGGVGSEEIARTLLVLLGDGEGPVAETAAWALGELGEEAVAAGAVGRLAEVAGAHGDPLVREAAVAALGALGDPDGLGAVLAACADKPAIRRRAVLALAAFEGPEVDAALRAALDDKDWQTRQAAEDLLGQ
ncbi:MAG TPA: HEAT repeat domain-containing protein, partial [Acidimicrobiia bacterium]|nr:HEAT repeat domain-containing protein [Acidimicrobiia bacterium]